MDFFGIDTFATHEVANVDELNFWYKEANFCIMNYNIRGITKHFDEFCVLLSNMSFKPEMIVLTETQMTSIVPFTLPNYNTYSFTNKHTSHDSVMILLKNNLLNQTVTPLNSMVYSNSLLVCFDYQGRSFRAIATYRSPSLNINNFLADLNNETSTTQTSDINLFLGDININTLGESALTQEYISLLSLNGYTSCITVPTRPESQTCLDHIYMKMKENFSFSSAVLDYFSSDHKPCFLTLDIAQSSCNSDDSITKAKISIDYKILKEKIDSDTWNDLYIESDPTTALDIFYDKINQQITASSKPIPKPHRKLKILKPWITKGTIISIRNRDKLYKGLMRHKSYCQKHRVPVSYELQENFVKYRNWLNKILKNQKEDYYRDKFENSHNMKQKWDLMKEITDFKILNKNTKVDYITMNGSQVTSSKAMADNFNKFFINITDGIVGTLPKSQTSSNSVHFQRPKPEVLQTFAPVQEDEIIKNIKSLKNNTANGPDGISAKLLKLCTTSLSKPLVHIFNLIILTCRIPDKLKTAVVTPIFKAGKKDIMDNYRPISLISHVAKLLELCLKSRIFAFLHRTNFLSDNQFGFRPHKGTEDAIYKLLSCLTNNMDSKLKSIVIFLDLRKAFDLVNHDQLIRKIEECGISGSALSLVTDYLSNRIQFTKINSVLSESGYLKAGVPQGTILGPLFFLIYINSLCCLDLPASILSYADDTCLIIGGNTWADAHAVAEQCMEKVINHLNCDLLSLNYNKTNYICFFNSKKSAPNDCFSIKYHQCNNSTNCDCSKMVRVQSAKYLGLIIDERLRFTEHINKLSKKIKQCSYIFYRTRNIVSTEFLKMMYFGIIHSSITYAAFAWGGTYDSHLHPVEISQKLILKIMYRKSRLYPTEQLYVETKMLNISQIINIQIAKFFIKRQDLLHKQVPPHNTRTPNVFTIPHKSSKLYLLQAPYRGPVLLNSIPKHLLDLPFTAKRKNELKTWVMRNIK